MYDVMWFCSQQGEFCTYHVQSAYKKHSAKRSELQAGYVLFAYSECIYCSLLWYNVMCNTT